MFAIIWKAAIVILIMANAQPVLMGKFLINV